jgi:hypothetical protein
VNSKPSAGATYERSRRLANVAIWSIELQCRSFEAVEPEDGECVLRKWADFDSLIVALTRLRRATALAGKIHDYVADQGRQKAVARQSLEVSRMEADGPTLSWLQASLNAREASQASRALFAALREASSVFRVDSPT